MDVVSPELNSLLPDEIMDTEAIEHVPPPQPDGAAPSQPEPGDNTSVPMETDSPVAAKPPEAASSSTDSSRLSLSGAQSASSAAPTLLTLRASTATSTATTRTTDSVSATVSTSTLHKLSAPFTISAANHQIILNKVASAQASEAAKAAGGPAPLVKPEGQKLLVTAIGKSGQPIVLQLPHTGTKPGGSQAPGDAKAPGTQFKVVTIGGRSELKPVVSAAGTTVATLQAQQLKTVQVTLTQHSCCSHLALGT